MSEAATRPYSPSARSARDTTLDPGPLGATLAAAVGAIACLLPWFRVDLSKMGSMLDAAMRDARFTVGGSEVSFAGARPEGFGQAMEGMFGALGVQGSVNAAGVDGWVGVAVLVLLVGAVGAQLGVTSVAAESRRALAVGGVVSAAVAACLTVYACTQLGGPIAPHVGLGVAVVGATVASVLAARRLGALSATAS